ncbi:MAG: exopolysaccharide biosynthesis polyprenyl glycosylphosphotransferase [Ignavibacteriae bacterium]|nr:exopolysaccharide biosynthesis polyprenyl glycosylphosphotransferase [Ignavibacteriota bacterium]
MVVNKKSLKSLRLITDFLFLNICFLLAAFIAQPIELFFTKNFHIFLLPVINILWFVSASITKMHREVYTQSIASLIFKVVKNVFVQIVFTIIFLFFIKEDLFTRNFIVLFGLFLTIIIFLKELVLNKIITSQLKNKVNRRKLAIVGSGELGQKFKSLIDKNITSYNFEGFIDEEQNISNSNYLGSLNNFEKIITETGIRDVVFAMPLLKSDRLKNLLRVADKHAVQVSIVPDYMQFVSNKFQIDLFENFPIITVRPNPLDELQWRFVKRSIDIAVSIFTFLILLWWLIPLISIIIKITSRGNIFFIQDRVGKNNKYFRCYKFRTMTIEASSNTSSTQPVTTTDSRITKIGMLLRKSNLDEIPQFINVLNGTMSLVGPRPHAIPFEENYTEMVEEIKLRHRVKPGITGWAQIHGLRGDVFDFEENKKRTQKRIDYDIWYIENWSLKLDLQIIIETFLQIILGKNKGN